MRTARITGETEGYYHCMSRIIERRRIIGTAEKQRFSGIMRRLEGFCGLQVLTYALLDSHFHILLHVPPRRDLSDEELLERLAFLYPPEVVKQKADMLAGLRKDGLDAAAERFKAGYTYRMYDLSQFMKTLKQMFSQYYNRKKEREGPLWSQRFKSVLVEPSAKALRTVAAYIDLNAVRAGLAKDPAQYRYCGYGEAMGGSKLAREGLKAVFEEGSWTRTRRAYRQRLFQQGETRRNSQGVCVRPGFSAEEVKQVLDAGGRLPAHELLRCRVRYFSDGLVLGSKDFVEETFARYHSQFGPKRRDGARPMRYGQWDGLCTMRDLRSAVIFVPTG